MNTKNSEEDFEVGKLLAFRDLTETQKDIFIKLVSNEYSYMFQVLFNVLEDDYLALELIDILAGQKLQIPSRKKLYKLLEKISIYTYIKSKNNSPEAYKLLAKQYNIRISQVKSAVNRVEQLLKEHNNIKEDIENDNNS